MTGSCFFGRIVIKFRWLVYINRRNISSDFHDDWLNRKNIGAKKTAKTVFCKFQLVDLYVQNA
jgi:hypothetical protein